MYDRLNSFKAACVSLITAIAALLGWQGVLIVVWVCTMCLDFLSGTIAACCAGEWCSAVARDGVKHKGGMILVVAVSALTDITLSIICSHLPVAMNWPVVLMPMVLAWYILTELGSILENAIKIGAPVPKWLVALLNVGIKAIDKSADNGCEDENS